MNWLTYDSLPNGYILDKTAGSPKTGYSFATNGKSIFNGGKRILVRIFTPQHELFTKPIKHNTPACELSYEPINTAQEKNWKHAVIDEKSAKIVNELARARFKQQMLNDILIDLTICEIESWDKSIYINELKSLINGIKVSKPIQLTIES